ncbi:MAG: peptidylprolyl isomerase [Phycisphaerae bacterium]
MKCREAALLCAVALCLGGCGWVTAPWTEDTDEKPVPVTPPVEQQELPEPQPQEGTDAEPQESHSPQEGDEPSVGSEPERQTQPQFVPVEPESSEPLPPQPAEQPEDAEDREERSPAPSVADDSPSEPPSADDAEIVGEPEVVAASMIQVNGRFITIEDVLRSVRAELQEAAGAPEPVFRNRAAQIIASETRRQVGQILLAAEAERRLTDRQKQAVEAELERVRKDMLASAGGSETNLDARLRQQGVTLDEVLAEQRRYLTVQFYLQSRFMPAISVTRRDLWDYYREHTDEFSSDRKVQMQLIAAPVTAYLPDEPGEATSLEVSAARDKAREDMRQAMAELREGRDFSEVVQEYSRGVKADEDGIWPLMPAGSFRLKEVERAAFALDEGEFSDIIETDTGFYIVKAHRVEPGETVGFEQAQERIEQTLRQQRYEQAVQDYMERLMGEATVVETERFITMAVDQAVRRFGDG